MRKVIKTNDSDLLGKDPLDLVTLLRAEIDVEVPEALNTQEEVSMAVNAMNKLTAYISYFKEMETIARILKRQQKGNKEEAVRLLGVEEVFETYKRACEQNYEYVTKLMTMKRLMIDEAKILGKTV